MDHSWEQRLLAIEERFRGLDEIRRSNIPDSYWNHPRTKRKRADFKALDEAYGKVFRDEPWTHQAQAARRRQFFESLRNEADSQAGKFDGLVASFKAEGATQDEAEVLGALELYESDGTVAVGFAVTKTAKGYKIERQRITQNSDSEQ